MSDWFSCKYGWLREAGWEHGHKNDFRGFDVDEHAKDYRNMRTRMLASM
jgi:hypothetical protein